MRLNLYAFLFSILCLIGTLYTQAQTPAVPNGGFENWTNAGGSNEEPTNWNSTKTGGGYASLGPQVCSRDGSAHSGSYCVKMETKTYFGTPVNGSATTGRIEAPSTNPSQGYIQTVIGNTDHSYAFTGRPDSLVGWFKYTKSGSSTADISVILHVSQGTLPENSSCCNTTANVVGRARYTITATQSGWARFSVPFEYVDNRTPAYFLCAMNAGAVSGAILYVDDLEVIYNPALTLGTVSTGPFYVSSTTGANLSVPFTAVGNFAAGNAFTAQLSNASGSFASPTNIGSISGTTSGTINATIPMGTAAGTGYRIRVVSTNPAITSNNNGSDITINSVSTSIAPSTAQTITANIPGAPLMVTESPVATSREWKYSTTSGGPYTSFAPLATGNNFTPQFTTPGTYYVVAVSTYPGGFVTTSNQVQVTVVGNSIAPTSSQSLLVGATGSLLTVTETPAGTSREWKYATSPGGPYQSFSPAETGATYAPMFNTGGTYYVVAQSIINGQTVTSNEVEVSVSSINLVTGTISPTAFYFSPSAPSATVSIPFTTTSSFINGNVFTAQLSDANGNFGSPINIGALTSTGSGTITGTILSTTAAGTGYRIRVVSSNPQVNGTNNGTDLLVDQFNNSISPATAQSYTVGGSGTAITVNESQNASREWKYATVSGGPYMSFNPPQTGVTYTPAFNTIGTYYVIAVSQNQYSDLVTSNEAVIDVVNGTTLTTSAITGSPFLVSPSSNVQVQVDFTTDIVFGGNNTFTAELSDANGDFSNAVAIGTATSGTSINAVIPSNTLGGNGYRIRVVSTNPSAIGTDNGSDLEVIPFEIAVTPLDSQLLVQNTAGTTITITETHPATREWLASISSGFGYGSFTPAETGTAYTPNFAYVGTRYVVARSVNQWGDTLTSPEIVMVVSPFIGLGEAVGQSVVTAYWNNNDLMIDLSGAHFENPTMQLFDLTGKLVAESSIANNTLNTVNTILSKGIYILQITAKNESFKVKTLKP